ncbi:MAG: T9SS type A sorting domain-containing protein, partial [Schleiferiaceae bacterium]
VYPNPTNGRVELLVDVAEGTEVHYELYDITGRSVYRGAFNAALYGIEELDLHHLPSGAYVLKIQVGSNVYNERLLIE